MHLARLIAPSLAGLLLLAPVAWGGASEDALHRCHEVATRCKAAGGNAAQCQRQVDACMSDNACEEVYLSCLELMEVDEDMTEAACGRKRAECRKRYGQG